MKLATLQRRFAAALREPQPRPSPALAAVIARRGRHGATLPPFGAAARLHVYSHAYLARLVEVLAGDYGAVKAWLGDERFDAFARRYLAMHPSRHPNLNRLGAKFPAFLRRAGAPRFAHELARLELALTIAFDAPEFAPLPAEALTTLPPSRWGRVRLQVNPSVQLLRVPAAAVDFHAAWRRGDETPRPRSGSVHLCVFRNDDRLGTRVLVRDAAALLASLVRGERLAAAVARLPAGTPVDSWFAEWRADGVFTGLH